MLDRDHAFLTEGKKMKKVSVVVPCYNTAGYLDCCMEHLLKQTIGLENIEIILVDDASTDDGATLGLIMEYEKKFPDTIIAIPLEQNMRQGGARNVGISYAGGEYLMFCDADDWLALDAMEILYRTAEEYHADVVEYLKKEVTDYAEAEMEEKEEYEVQLLEMENEELKKGLITCSVDIFGLGCMDKLYRLHMIQSNHIRFAEHFICEEPSFTLPVRLYEKNHVCMNKVLYFYFQSPNSTVRHNWDDRKFDNIKVWINLMEDLEERGFLQKYPEELECMFFEWGFGLSIQMLLQKGYIITKEEMQFFKESLLRFFPQFQKNPYIKESVNNGWHTILMTILESELTEEMMLDLNKVMVYYLAKCEELEEKSS